jgi:hypothetical protein
MGKIGHGAISHDAGHSLDGVNRAEGGVYRRAVSCVALEPEEGLVDGNEVVTTLGEKESFMKGR